MGIKNYLIAGDSFIHIHGNVDLKDKNIHSFPDFIRFKNVDGYFDCSYNKLSSLKGSPVYVGSNFICSNNNLKSLEGSPDLIRGNLICKNNPLETLEGFPSKVEGHLLLNKGLFSPLTIETMFDIAGGVYEFNPNFPN